jgi:hypothetical protein
MRGTFGGLCRRSNGIKRTKREPAGQATLNTTDGQPLAPLGIASARESVCV